MNDEGTQYDIRYNHEAAINLFIDRHVDFVDRFNGHGEESRADAIQAMNNIRAKAWEEGFEAGNGLEFNINTPNPYLEE